MDRLAEEDLAEQELAGLLSKVSQAVQSLEISNSPKAPSENGLQQLAASPDSVLHSHPPRGKSASQGATDATQSGRPGQLYNDKPTVAAGGEDEDNWQKASSSHNAARKKKRKQQRRCAVQAVSETSQAEPASSVLPEATVISSDMSVTHPRTGTDAQTVTNASEASQMVSNDAMATTDAPTKASSPETSHIPPAEQGITGGASAACSQSEDEESASSSSDASDDADSGSEQDYSDDDLPSEAEDAAAAQSSVASVTADFAMQNVILQMGLRLVAPNGMRIKQLSRWVLRCSACFKITKEPGRLFCPHCGNSTLEKVEAVIGPDGTEQYGVRKRFNTRGTRYSLPKPKGGYQKNAPILREDVLMQKLNKRRNRKPKDEAVDAFAPEYGPDSWFQKNHGSAAQYKGAAAALASWKHNPNERRHTRTNRRKK
ncbi:TPA: hypothetical protein ACH3X2_005564 [Trebouxia sp. C0005]